MDEGIKYYSEMERFEIINVNDGNKFSALGSNDVVIDEDGNLKMLILGSSSSKLSLFAKEEFTEIPWEYIKKIGAKTVIIDVDDKIFKKNK